MADQEFTAEDVRNYAEAELFQAQAREALAKAKTAEMALKDKRRAERESQAGNKRNWVYHFEHAVRDTQPVRETFDTWHRLDPNADWTIVYNSPGGSVIDGNALLDHLCAYSKRWGGTHHITSVTRGYSASMTALLAQAADHRRVGPMSVLMLHKISTVTGGSLDDLEDEVTFLRMLTDADEEFLAQRSDGKLSKTTLRRKYARRDWWVSASEAVKYGLADEIG